MFPVPAMKRLLTGPGRGGVELFHAASGRRRDELRASLPGRRSREERRARLQASGPAGSAGSLSFPKGTWTLGVVREVLSR